MMLIFQAATFTIMVGVMMSKSIILNSIQLQKKMLSLFAVSKNIVIISPFINFSKFFDYYNGERIKIATNFTKEIFERGSSDIEFFVRATENNAEIRHIENLHSKIYVFDDCIIIGSSNFTYGGLKKNVETNVLISKENKTFESIKEEALKLYNGGKIITEDDITKMIGGLLDNNFSKNYLSNLKESYKDDLVIIVRPSLLQTEINKASTDIFYKHESFSALEAQIKNELKKSDYQYISIDSYTRLMVWMYPTPESCYKNAAEPTKKLSQLLFGYVIPEKIEGKAFGRYNYINKYEKEIIKHFHEDNLKF